ncbi:hypothetical protein [Halostella sp. PRR32]|uniref:LVIVD repeat-containing protein n=1 Tax=Halostella sp. PRR32 TaxID=3098147 RepID=UPI002B1D811A|nr:hypothetical protein [Halostella sp. PRR32]
MERPRTPRPLRRDVLKASGAALSLPVIGGVAAGQESDGYSPLGRYDIPHAKEVVVDDEGTTAYVALTDGYAVFDVSDPANPEPLVTERELVPENASNPLGRIYDVKQDGDHLVVASQAGSTGVLGYDVSTPSEPERIGFFPIRAAIHNCYVKDGYAYLGALDGEANPVVIVDLETMEEVGRWSVLDDDEQWGEVPFSRRQTHDLYVQDDLAYVALWDTGTWIVDVSDPSNPELVTRFGDHSKDEVTGAGSPSAGLEPPGNSHYVQPNEDGSVVAVGKEAWDAGNSGSGGPGGIHFWDVSDPSSPEEIGAIEPNVAENNAYDGGTWTTSHNFDWVGDRLYTSWYQDGVKVFDVSDPSNPERLSWWRQPEETSIWTAQCAVQDDFYVATSLGTGLNDTEPAALFTFPDEAGEQENRPALPGDSSSSTTSTTTTQTTTVTDDGTETDGGGTTAETDGENDDGDDSDGGSLPGFGVGAALAGLGLGALRYRGNDNDS